jgi:hypothetical protein
MTTYVLIPGACYGAWCFHDLAAALRSHGHRVFAYTVTGIVGLWRTRSWDGRRGESPGQPSAWTKTLRRNLRRSPDSAIGCNPDDLLRILLDTDSQ